MSGGAPDDRLPGPLAPPPGLCAACRHAEWLASRRSGFLRCRRSFDEPEFPRYPSLPVTSCRGFVPRADTTGLR